MLPLLAILCYSGLRISLHLSCDGNGKSNDYKGRRPLDSTSPSSHGFIRRYVSVVVSYVLVLLELLVVPRKKEKSIFAKWVSALATATVDEPQAILDK